MLELAVSTLFGPITFLAIGIVVVAVVCIIQASLAKKRRREMSDFAAENGLQFLPLPGSPHDSFEGFGPFGQGHSRRSRNLITGPRDGIAWEMFDYQFTTGSGKSQQTHHYGIVVGRVPLSLGRVEVRPEGLFDKIAAMVGFDDIDFESEEFSRAYYVKAADRKLAYDLIHPQMIEFLLAAPRCHWQIEDDVIMICRSRFYAASEFAGIMQLIAGFYQRIPPFVRQDYGTTDLPVHRQTEQRHQP